MARRHFSKIWIGWGKGAVLSAGILIAGLLVFILSSGKAYSMSNGLLTGRSATGCTPCHGSSASTNVKVSISGPTTVSVGNIAQYTVTITGNPEAGGGLDASANGGKLSPGENTQLVNGEITNKNKDSRSWTFSWTAPASPGQFKLNAVGNAVNKDNSPAGDGWNLATLDISVVEASQTVTTPSSSSPSDGGSSISLPVANGNAGPAQVTPVPPAPKAPTLSLKLPEEKAGQGTSILTAYLKDGTGKPISGATVSFYVDTTFFLSQGNGPVQTSRGTLIPDYGAPQGGNISGLMELGESQTNTDGLATLRYTPAIRGDLKLVAKYNTENQTMAETNAIWQSVEHKTEYHPEIGIKTSFLNPKIILGTILGSIWWIFLFVLYQVYAISKDKPV